MRTGPFIHSLILCLAASGCVKRAELPGLFEQTAAQVSQARSLHADLCAPHDFARAETQLAFARTEFDAADPKRAQEHLAQAADAVDLALTHSRDCGLADRDGDGIPDVIDQCPNDREDFDGDRDEDGCPDFDPEGDDDGDGIPNARDLCPTEPENFNRFEDDDGCPDAPGDRDGDGVIDALDACPDEPEDRDGFEDDDGCPDPDNDHDGIPDASDNCPNAPEDLDGFQDDDGCPDDDNDHDGIHDLEDACPNAPGPISNRGCPLDDRDQDGIADDLDRCPDTPETFNGIDDDDGCPDGEPRQTTLEGDAITLASALVFDGDTLTPASDGALRDLAGLLSDRPGLRIRLESHVNATGDESADDSRAAKRAEQVYARLLQYGVSPDRVDVLSYGGTRPIDTNRTASGRARNQRIEIVIVH